MSSSETRGWPARLKDSVLRGLGWVMLVGVLPFLLAFLSLWCLYFRQKQGRKDELQDKDAKDEPQAETLEPVDAVVARPPDDPVPFLSAIRYQAHRQHLEDVDSLPYEDLRARENRLNVMLYFLETNPSLLPRAERSRITEKLQDQRALVQTWARAKYDAHADDFQRFKSRLLQMQMQRGLGLARRVVEVE